MPHVQLARLSELSKLCAVERGSDLFLDAFDVTPERPDLHTLGELGGAFSMLPYENLTKVIRKAEGPASARRRSPLDVARDHLEHGTGGTCFALTRLFQETLERVGYGTRVVLCDTTHRVENHCALVVDVQGRPYLMDPAYLLHEPIALEHGAEQGAARLELTSEGEVELHTYGKRRYRVRLTDVDDARYERIWEASFDWTMMGNIHIAAPEEGGFAYVHGHKLRLQRGESDKRTLNLRGREVTELARRFGISETIIRQAYALVNRSREDGR